MICTVLSLCITRIVDIFFFTLASHSYCLTEDTAYWTAEDTLAAADFTGYAASNGKGGTDTQ